MPNFEYDKDYPFAAFITSLGKYNEGELIGEWVKFPTSAEKIRTALDSIGIGQEDDFGNPYEEWFITDYDCYVDGLYDKLGEYENLDELNYLAAKLDDMTQGEYEQFQAAMEVGDHCGSLQEIINLTENLDCYDVYPDINDYDDLGRYYIEELDAMQVPEYLRNYIDYEAYGRDVALDENGQFTSYGYVWDTGGSFVEVYDGNRENIPEEYRVMSTGEEELTEEEIAEWASDIAYDMDSFFRQNDPQYALAFPVAGNAQLDIQEKLLDGRIADYEEKLAAMGQKPEGDLLSELNKFKEATGYEEWLDIDPAKVREGLENPDTAHIDEMLAFAEKAEQAYAAEAEAFVQTPKDIVEQARAVYGEPDTFSIYQLKSGDETLDYRFEPLDSIRRNGLSVKPENYELVYQAPLAAGVSLEDIYTRFNIDRPADFTGHSLSISDIVVLHENGRDTAHYCDRLGFSQVPEFLNPVREKEATLPTPEALETGEVIRTPRGGFYVTAMSREQMEAAGYGFHHQSDDGQYLIMTNGTQAYAIPAEPEKGNPLRTAEMTIEDDYNMIDGVINNGRRDEEQEKVKPSIREQLENAKRECAERKSPDKGHPSRSTPEHGDL
ncbi:MAG: antirestriction protein ArdA [Oscillospiraceae bacterium]|nr:antirestriction protein ArdA [Oscillospiraceae bacterium]